MLTTSKRRWGLPAALLILAVIPAAGDAADTPEPPPGEGVICALGIVHASAEVGRVCFPGRDPAVQAELERTGSRLDAYVLTNSGEMTPALLAEFKAEQSLVGTPKEKLCKSEAVGLYEAIAKQYKAQPEEWTARMDRLLARPGKPTWGTCL